MKLRKLVIGLFCLGILLAVFGSCATDKIQYISRDHEIYRTWVNPEHGGMPFIYQKIVFHPNGEMDFYRSISDTETDTEREFSITNK